MTAHSTAVKPDSNWRLNTPWRRMIAVNLLVMGALFIYKVLDSYPGDQYTQLLATYHFGFIKRALIGTIVSVGFPILPSWSPYLVGGMIWLVTAGLFVTMFKRTVGFANENLPLFIFTFGSPFFLKNFIQNLGYYDIYGCAFAALLLTIPARSTWYVVLAFLGCFVLILIHHIHMLMYVPTICLIVVLRHYVYCSLTAWMIVFAIAALGILSAEFLVAQFYGTVRVPLAEFIAYLHSRMTDENAIISPSIFYRTLAQETEGTRVLLSSNLARIPVYGILIAVHAPLISYFINLVRALAFDLHRKILFAGIAAITTAYLVIFSIAFDYARWISGWATCMILIVFAVRSLPTSSKISPIPQDDRLALRLGWILTLVPRVGTTKPF